MGLPPGGRGEQASVRAGVGGHGTWHHSAPPAREKAWGAGRACPQGRFLLPRTTHSHGLWVWLHSQAMLSSAHNLCRRLHATLTR